MLWVRGVIFTALVPFVIGAWIPSIVDPSRRTQHGAWDAGWALVAVGTAMYLLCLVRFLTSGGTPAIFFTRAIRALIGEEPRTLVLLEEPHLRELHGASYDEYCRRVPRWLETLG